MKIVKLCASLLQRWAPLVDQLADSLDSPVVILDSIPKTSDVRPIEPKTRWKLKTIVVITMRAGMGP